MRLLHTSDWHIGRTLHDKRRHDEHAAFLAWLRDLIEFRKVELLLVCGDIFDTITPGNRQLELYYSFLRSVSDTGCRHVVIIGGNHDSPSLLDAPREILQTMGVHVVGNAPKDEAEAVLLLRDRKGDPEAIVCAVPFLRDRDVRISEEREHSRDKATRLAAGVATYYERVGVRARELKNEIESTSGVVVPIVVTGHLFTTGGKVTEDDGVRDLYVGTSAEIPATIFEEYADYIALGHLHVPQRVANLETIRYSGSPIPMGFKEATHQKQVVLVTSNDEELFLQIDAVPVPEFQKLQRISGSLDEIESALQDLVQQDVSVWVEVEYDGTLSPTQLREQLDAQIEGSSVEILKLGNTRMMDRMLQRQGWEQTLDDLDEREVFARRLAVEDIDEQECAQLTQLYESILYDLHEEVDQE